MVQAYHDEPECPHALIGALAMMAIGTEQALALSVLLGFAILANGLIGVLPLAFGGDRFVAVRGRSAAIGGA
jgi:hypothetical protein